MFNEPIKKMYIDELKQVDKSAEKIMGVEFRKCESLEEELGKDISCFTSSEIISYYKSLLSRSFETLMVINIRLSKYTNWCIDRNLVSDMQNHFNELDHEVLMSCLNAKMVDQKIITREQLLDWTHYTDVPGEKFIALAIFEGIGYANVLELGKLSLKDFDHGKVHLYTGRTLDISDELYRFAIESSETYEYIASSLNKRDKLVKYDPTDNGIIKRGANARDLSDENTRRRILALLGRIRAKGGTIAYTKKGLLDSGRIHYIKELMKKEDGTDVKSYINRDEITVRFGFEKAKDRWMLKYGKYFEE